jgi:hypothetical protein
MAASIVVANLPISDTLLREWVEVCEVIYGRKLTRHESLVFAAVAVLEHYLGNEWVMEHERGDGGRASFMRPQHDPHPRPRVRAEELDHFRSNDRAFRLAERLMNFHGMDGIQGRIDRLRAGDLESVIAELEAAEMIRMSGIPFRFVKEQSLAGLDYDLEMTLGETVVACETKCKVEDTVLSENTIRNSLEKANSQLPKDKPGVVFLKIPELWTKDRGGNDLFGRAITSTFRNVKRSSAIVVHWEEWGGGSAAGAGGTRRFALGHNPNARFRLAQFGEFIEPNRAAHWRGLEEALFGRRADFVRSVAINDLAGGTVEVVHDLSWDQ